ncbi:protein adenylyltransferase SelO [Pseudoalteromonas piscicida]|uniref:protein adenylyltransferase SelO n=1 Tax=Pseudoalteromonas piscicida TaxID=43662 RepID=UPI0030B314D1
MTYFQPYKGSTLLFDEQPARFTQPRLLLVNAPLLKKLGLAENSTDHLAELLSGQRKLGDIAPMSLAYSGHQFGQFNPLLGDGRAHLIGGIKGLDGTQYDLHLKGSGATRFSRGGDGFCALGPAVREFVMSQAMVGLGVPTTECLSVVTTGEQVYRQGQTPGAVVCRVAQSHIRVGTMQYLATQQDNEAIWQLLKLLGAQLFDGLEVNTERDVIELFREVCERLVDLVVEWMRVGFIHGVMNTDNILLSGETIDYGPCAMMEKFNFNAVFSSIDRQGRYAFGNQPNIMNWNCARLAESLLVLWQDEQQGLEALSHTLAEFSESFNRKYKDMWAAKLGIDEWHEADDILLGDLLKLMTEHELDFTNTFAALTNSLLGHPNKTLRIPSELESWQQRWQQRRAADAAHLMSQANPILIPRNALVEAEIEQFNQHGASHTLAAWLNALTTPYEYKDYPEAWMSSSTPEHYQTFCGT